MKQRFDGYERLGRGNFGLSSLWMGEDHLLLVRGKGLFFPISERYSRYRFRDIQSLALAPSDWFGKGLWLYGGTTFLFGTLLSVAIVLSLAGDGEFGWMFASLFSLAPFLIVSIILLVRHLVRGQRCDFEIQTDLQRERLLPLASRRQAEVALAALQPKIATAQSEVIRNESGDVREALPRPNEPSKLGASVVTAFVFSVIYAIVTGLLPVFGGSALAGFSIFFGGLVTLMIVIALASAGRISAAGSVRRYLWLTAGSLLGIGVTVFLYYVTMGVVDPGYTTSELGFIEALADMSYVPDPEFRLAFAGICGFIIVLSIVGTIASSRWRALLNRMSAT